MAPPSLAELRGRREEIIAAAHRRRASRVRVFGSDARGDAGDDSDVDLLVDLEPGRNLMDLGGLLMDLRDLLRCDVHVATQSALRPRVAARAMGEAIDLQPVGSATVAH